LTQKGQLTDLGVVCK